MKQDSSAGPALKPGYHTKELTDQRRESGAGQLLGLWSQAPTPAPAASKHKGLN